jgi:hypothetical protein
MEPAVAMELQGGFGPLFFKHIEETVLWLE